MWLVLWTVLIDIKIPFRNVSTLHFSVLQPIFPIIQNFTSLHAKHCITYIFIKFYEDHISLHDFMMFEQLCTSSGWHEDHRKHITGTSHYRQVTTHIRTYFFDFISWRIIYLSLMQSCDIYILHVTVNFFLLAFLHTGTSSFSLKSNSFFKIYLDPISPSLWQQYGTGRIRIDKLFAYEYQNKFHNRCQTIMTLMSRDYWRVFANYPFGGSLTLG